MALILTLATLLTQSRNAYLGLALGVLALVLLWKRNVIFLLPFLLSLLVLVSPPMIRERMFSIVNLQDASVMNRFYMMETGAKMVSDFPLFGVGMQQVEELYNRYKPADDPGDVPHLHNNVFQLAAERGLPALFLWLWFIAALAFGHYRLYKRQKSPPWLKIAAAVGFIAVVALFTAGIFEYNFGDSEVQMFFFLLIALPFGLARLQIEESRT
jgi:O-antigen ligase